MDMIPGQQTNTCERPNRADVNYPWCGEHRSDTLCSACATLLPARLHLESFARRGRLRTQAQGHQRRYCDSQRRLHRHKQPACSDGDCLRQQGVDSAATEAHLADHRAHQPRDGRCRCAHTKPHSAVGQHKCKPRPERGRHAHAHRERAKARQASDAARHALQEGVSERARSTEAGRVTRARFATPDDHTSTQACSEHTSTL